jgi:acetyltransferase-like isoleucine patch superfamily enzyme
MRTNLKQTGKKNADGSSFIANDWYDGVIPSNVKIGPDVYLDSSYGFIMFNSTRENGMVFGKASASYDQAMFVTSEAGKIRVGEFSILNGTTLICSDTISIGNFVMLAWGSVVIDNFLCADLTPGERGRILELTSGSLEREMPFSGSAPVIIEDNVWVGFDAVILPGTTIGRGSVIGSRCVVSGNIPPYSVVVGNPGRIIKTLEQTDRNRSGTDGIIV